MAGDHDAFSELARGAIARLYAAALLILRDQARAEDATQDEAHFPTGSVAEDDVASVRREQTLENFDRRRLAGAVRSEQAKAFTAANLEVETVNRRHVAVALHYPAASHCLVCF